MQRVGASGADRDHEKRPLDLNRLAFSNSDLSGLGCGVAAGKRWGRHITADLFCSHNVAMLDSGDNGFDRLILTQWGRSCQPRKTAGPESSSNPNILSLAEPFGVG